MKIKKETDGSFKNAKFSSQGCTVIGGQLNNLPFYGSRKVSDKSIVSTKLPLSALIHTKDKGAPVPSEICLWTY